MTRGTIEQLCEHALKRGHLRCVAHSRTGFGWAGCLSQPPLHGSVDALKLCPITVADWDGAEKVGWHTAVDREHPFFVAFEEIAVLQFEPLQYPERLR